LREEAPLSRSLVHNFIGNQIRRYDPLGLMTPLLRQHTLLKFEELLVLYMYIHFATQIFYLFLIVSTPTSPPPNQLKYIFFKNHKILVIVLLTNHDFHLHIFLRPPIHPLQQDQASHPTHPCQQHELDFDLNLQD
jgi:hypothetical protein